MKPKDQKIILVDETPAESFNQAKSFLEADSYEIKASTENSDADYFLEAHNKEKRFWKLFTSSKPQILNLFFRTSQDKDNQTEISINYDYFKHFFSKIYLLIVLSLGLYHLAFSSFVTAVESPGTDPIVFMIAMVLGMTLFVVYTMLFFAKLLIGFYDYDAFFGKLCSKLSSDSFELYHSRSPRQKIVLIASISGIILLLIPYISDIFTFPTIISNTIIILLGLAFILTVLFWRLFHSTVIRRVLFLTHVLSGVFAVAVYLHILTFTGLVYKSFAQHGLLLSEAVELMFQEQTFIPGMPHFVITLFLIAPIFILAVFILVFYSHLFQRLHSLKTSIQNFKKDQRIINSSNALVYRTSTKDNLLLSVIIVFLWLILTATIITGLVFSFGLLEHVLLGNNHLINFGFLNFIITELKALYVFIFHKTNLYANVPLFRLLLFVYLLPVLLIVVLQLIPNIKRFVKTRLVLKQSSTNINIQSMLEKIALANNIRIPKSCLTNEPGISVKSLYVGFPHMRNFILLSKTTIDELNDSELEAILAHEIYHIKKHTFIFRLLNMFSEWTLLGKGFLVTILNPVSMEFESDGFAVSWLRQQNIAKEIYINVLKKIDILKVKTMFANPIAGLGIAENTINISEKRNLKHKICVLLDLYFGEEILSYIYPTTEERIQRIKETENAS